jgi:hypothetical protein
MDALDRIAATSKCVLDLLARMILIVDRAKRGGGYCCFNALSGSGASGLTPCTTSPLTTIRLGDRIVGAWVV